MPLTSNDRSDSDCRVLSCNGETNCYTPSSYLLLTANHFRDTFCVITSNFVETSQTVAEISHFSCFFKLYKNPLDDRA